MNTVTFPGLGLSFELNRVAFSIGDFNIYWYGIIIAIGFALGTGFCCYRAKDFGLRSDDILDLLLFAAPGGIIGARLYYIIFNPDLYKNADGSLNIKACLNVHNGGLAI
ncbi:MAG: prolipoprotein diacylglyceryl transferase, partial [Ruminiclostridium sp.]|nr:prolipoprotein diacylglyceryl transferase [Ruminiclostridium sp.]